MNNKRLTCRRRGGGRFAYDDSGDKAEVAFENIGKEEVAKEVIKVEPTVVVNDNDHDEGEEALFAKWEAD